MEFDRDKVQSEEVPAEDFDQIGYRPRWTGEDVTQENASIEPINEVSQARFEKALWELRQR
jgi:hypothetical protein